MPVQRERVLEHRQVERDVVRDEHGAVEQLEQLASDLAEGRRGHNILVADPVHRRRLGRDRTRGANELRESGCLNAVRVEPHDGERDNLVQLGRRTRCLAVEDRVGDRRRHVRPLSHAPRGATDMGRNRHVPTMSRAPDGDLTPTRLTRYADPPWCIV